MAEPRPFLVEVTGVAGSGKSTLARLLADRAPGARLAEFIQTRDPRHLALTARALPRLLPILLANLAMPPRLSWADVKLLVYVTAWGRVLDGPRYAAGITVLDQGPLYALVRLRAQARGVTRSASFSRWWDAALERWAEAISAVVALDADDDALLRRIDRRDQAHATKGRSEDAARAFLDRYRALFEELLVRLERPGGPEILRVDTTSTTAEATADALAPALAARVAPAARSGGVR